MIETQKWGLYTHHALFAIINLDWVCRGTDMNPSVPNHPITMRTYAESAYAILVGETFTGTLGL